MLFKYRECASRKNNSLVFKKLLGSKYRKECAITRVCNFMNKKTFLLPSYFHVAQWDYEQ